MTLGPVRLRNRTVKAATFEGRAPHGQVTDELIDYHRAVTEGGVGLTTVAYLAVAPEGRTHREQIVVGERHAAGAARGSPTRSTRPAPRSPARSATRDRSPTAARTASGHSAPAGCPARSRCRWSAAATEADLTADHRAVRRDRAHPGARRLRRARAAHGAQLPDLQLPRARRSTGARTAGAARSRTAPGSARQVARAVRDEVGGEVAVTAKVSLGDGFRGGRHDRRGDRAGPAAGGRRHGRRAAAERRQLADEPDVPLPRRRARQGVRGRDAAAGADRGCARWAGRSSRSTPSRRPTSARRRCASARRCRCR